jgi:hypothetical protein
LEKDYLRFLLTTTREQGRALLSTATRDQARTLVEICFNLAHLVDLGPDSKFVEYLGSGKHSLRFKKSLVRKYGNRLLKVLTLYKDRLLEL